MYTRISKANEEIPIEEFVSQKLKVIEREIKTLSTEYIMGVDKDQFINMLVAKYSIFFDVYYDTERLSSEGQFEKAETYDRQYYYNLPPTYTVYKFCLKYKFSGDIDVLRVKPECFRWSTLYRAIPIEVIGDDLYIKFTTSELDTNKIRKLIGEIKSIVFGNLDNNGGAKWHINLFNERLPKEIKKIFERVKAEKERENSVLKELGVINHFSKQIEVPIIKKITPIPFLLESSSDKIAYCLNDVIYKDIIKKIYELCKEFEQHNSLYRGKHEEDLRDLIIPTLNVVFKGTNSTGETFNKAGKTDIITKAPDGSNIFIAECKVWYGEKELSKAIDQLLGYITWRDTRTAIILFVKKNGIIDIVKKAKNTMTQHSCYICYNGQTNDSSFSYTFHLKEDSTCQFVLELMIFHYPE